MDAIDCTVEGDLELESDNDRKTFSKSRPNQRPYESSNSRSTRRSPPPPPSVNRKRPPSPVSSSSRSRNQHTSSSQKHYRNSSPSSPFILPKYHRKSPSSPPPLPTSSSSSSSRRHQSTRSTVPTKRPYSPADSSRDRRQPTSRSRTDFSSDNAFVSNSTSTDTRSIPKPNRNDLSYISDDEPTKKPDIKNSTAIVQSSPIPTTHHHHRQSTPSFNESQLETSAIPGECELSLFAKSTISNSNTSAVMPPGNNFIQTLDTINKYKILSGNTTSNSDPRVEMWLREIPEIIQKQIDLQKKELAVREREIKLREVEIAEKEERFKNKSTDNTNNIEPIKIKINEDKTPVKLENNIHHDIVNISPPEESVVKTIPSTTENSNSTTIPRKAGGKTRFSPIEIESLPLLSTDKPVVEHHPTNLDVNQTTRKSSVQENLLTDEPTLHPYSTELKVTSSSTSRKVEIQTGNHESTGTKSAAQDLRLTLSKNRSKYSSNDDNDQAAVEISPNSDEKQSSDYQSQRSITSTSIESNVDDQRDVHRRRQQQQQSYHHNNQRSYSSGSSAKYGSKQKRGDNPDLRSRLFEQNNSKSSRSTYKTNH